MGLTRQAVQRVINDLVRMEMVVLTQNFNDKRALLVSISEMGEGVMVKLDKII